MLKLGNIIYKDELVNHTKIDYINYIDIKNGGNDINISTSLPILFVGWNHFKRELNHFHENVSILKKEVKENLIYWEFSFNENKSQHVSGVEMFVRNVPYYYFRDKYKYINLDPIFNEFKDIADLMGWLYRFYISPNKIGHVYNYKNESLYFLNEGTIYGIDLNMYEFFNIEKENIINSLVSESTPYTLDLDGSIYQKEYKNFPFFEDLKRYLVVLLSKA